jgi:hypothetical protein
MLRHLLLIGEKLRKVEKDPLRQAFWFGYVRGIRRAIAGEEYGTEEGHKRLHDIPKDEPDRKRGDRAGLSSGLQRRTPGGRLLVTNAQQEETSSVACKRKGVTPWETKAGKRIRTRVRNRK